MGIFTMHSTASVHQILCNLPVHGYHWWHELDLWLWPWDKATVLPMEESKLNDAVNGKTDEERSNEHVVCSQGIPSGRPNNQFHILLWRFMVTAWKCAKTLSRTLAIEQLAVASWQQNIAQFLFRQRIFDINEHDCHPPTLYLPGLVPWNFSDSPFEDTPFWHNRGNQDNCRQC
jgi:hypothetical protein